VKRPSFMFLIILVDVLHLFMTAVLCLEPKELKGA
jgi:hypothetical protein